MEEPSLEVVLKALDALFRKEDAQEKEQASRWLTQLQGSVRTCGYLITAHHACNWCFACIGPRVEGCRSVAAAKTRHGDQLFRSTNDAEQSAVSLSRAATGNTCGENALPMMCTSSCVPVSKA